MTVKRLENLALRAPCSSSRLADTSSVDTLAANQTVLSAFAAFTQQHLTGCNESTEEELNNSNTMSKDEPAGLDVGFKASSYSKHVLPAYSQFCICNDGRHVCIVSSC